jgi:hypothetical protein
LAFHDTIFINIPSILWLNGYELGLAQDLEPLRNILVSSVIDSTILYPMCPLGLNDWVSAKKGSKLVFSKLVGTSKDPEDMQRNIPNLRM